MKKLIPVTFALAVLLVGCSDAPPPVTVKAPPSDPGTGHKVKIVQVQTGQH